MQVSSVYSAHIVDAVLCWPTEYIWTIPCRLFSTLINGILGMAEIVYSHTLTRSKHAPHLTHTNTQNTLNVIGQDFRIGTSFFPKYKDCSR